MAIQLFVPQFDVETCLAQIRDCLERGWTGLGYKTVEFEKAWKAYTRLENAHFLNSATSGLHLALDIFKEEYGWADGDEILTTPLTFVSTNIVILHTRLAPVFVDVDQYLCIDPDDLERKITPRSRAVIFVGMGGNTGQFHRVKDICRKYGLLLVLDASHMAGTRLNGEVPRADCVVYSFQAVKNLPTADSGMICFADSNFDAVARKKSWLGINKDTYARASDSGQYKWKYEVEYAGFKYHGNSIMAAIALAQLPHLDTENARRREVAALYDDGFAGNSHITAVPTARGCQSARHLYQITTDDRDGLLTALNNAQIYPGVHFRDNSEYTIFAAQRGRCPNAARQSQRLLSLPLHMRLSRADVETVIGAINAYFR